MKHLIITLFVFFFISCSIWFFKTVEYGLSHRFTRPEYIGVYNTSDKIAICLVGQERTFQHPRVWMNILNQMVMPIRNSSDVFASIEPNSDSNLTSLLGILRGEFQAVNMIIRNKALMKYAIPALTAHTSCWKMITNRERIRKFRYKWVMKLRTDVVYKQKLPHHVNFPRITNFRSSVLYAECCGSCGFPTIREKERTTGTCDRYKDGKLGCVKDTWNLMSRLAAKYYFDRDLLERTRLKPVYCYSPMVECLLGCVLNKNQVNVHLVKLRRKIVRNSRNVPTLGGNHTLKLPQPAIK